MNSLTKEDKGKIINGDNEPLGRLFNDHYDYCIKTLSSMQQCSKIEAEDVFMDSLQVLRDKILRGNFEHNNLRGFLIVTAKNKLLNKLKRDRKTIDLEVDKVEAYLHHKKTNQNPFSSDLSSEQEQRVNFILEARKQIGASCQKLLHMNFDLGYKLKDLVSILKYNSYDSLKSTKSRCLKTLRKKVDILIQKSQNL